MAIDKAAELARPTPKKDPEKLSKSDLLLLKLSDEFSPATPGDWSPAPTSIGEALDQLAARVAALEP